MSGVTESKGIGRVITDALRRLSWSQADLARESGLDTGTISDVVNEVRWPRVKTQKKIEDALGLPSGTLERAHAGLIVGGDEDDDDVMLDLPDEALEGLSKVERDEVYATARAAALKRAREIRAGGQVGLFTVD